MAASIAAGKNRKILSAFGAEVRKLKTFTTKTRLEERVFVLPIDGHSEGGMVYWNENLEEESVELNELRALLRRCGVPFHTWGANGAKTLPELLAEINADETILIEQNGVLSRHVSCVNIDVFYEEGAYQRHLIEAYQIVKGTRRIRKREYSVIEKKRPREDPLLCAHRALFEELGIKGSLNFVAGTPFVETDISKSFRGLLTTYVIYPFELMLPEKWFIPEGYIDMSEAPDEITQFKWK